MTDLEKDILEIIKAHVGEEHKITQYIVADRYNKVIRDINDKTISYRKTRKVIEELIKQGYPIVSTPSNGGGYHWQNRPEEGLECARRIKRQAVKLFIKARKIRANSRMGQLDLDIRV